jgi:hypothetical protein
MTCRRARRERIKHNRTRRRAGRYRRWFREMHEVVLFGDTLARITALRDALSSTGDPPQWCAP